VSRETYLITPSRFTSHDSRFTSSWQSVAYHGDENQQWQYDP